jgi:hypothetical protein
MRDLMIAEMKRAIEIMEKKPEMTRWKQEKCYWREGTYSVIDREMVELKQIMKLIRKHSIKLEEEINNGK